jgi:hypothetical protein
MSKLKPLAALAAAALVAVVVSGCWTYSGMTMSKVKLAPGAAKKSTSNINVFAHPTSSQREYFFIFTGVGDESGLTFKNTGKFDLKRKFGNRPRQLAFNSEITQEIVAAGDCGQFDLTNFEDPITEGEYKALSTPTEFNNQGKTNVQAQSKITLKQDALSALGTDGIQDIGDSQSDVIILVGAWADLDDDGEVDAADEFECGGGAISVMETKFEDT